MLLTIPDASITPELVRSIKRILAAHPGTCPVHLAVPSERGTTRYELAPRVDPTGSLAAEIKPLVGATAWSG